MYCTFIYMYMFVSSKATLCGQCDPLCQCDPHSVLSFYSVHCDYCQVILHCCVSLGLACRFLFSLSCCHQVHCFKRALTFFVLHVRLACQRMSRVCYFFALVLHSFCCANIVVCFQLLPFMHFSNVIHTALGRLVHLIIHASFVYLSKYMGKLLHIIV